MYECTFVNDEYRIIMKKYNIWLLLELKKNNTCNTVRFERFSMVKCHSQMSCKLGDFQCFRIHMYNIGTKIWQKILVNWLSTFNRF